MVVLPGSILPSRSAASIIAVSLTIGVRPTYAAMLVGTLAMRRKPYEIGADLGSWPFSGSEKTASGTAGVRSGRLAVGRGVVPQRVGHVDCPLGLRVRSHRRAGRVPYCGGAGAWSTTAKRSIMS